MPLVSQIADKSWMKDSENFERAPFGLPGPRFRAVKKAA